MRTDIDIAMGWYESQRPGLGIFGSDRQCIPFGIQFNPVKFKVLAMSKSAMVRARIEPELKKHTEDIFQHLGLSVTQAITLFYKQVEARNGLPFNVVIPTTKTLKTFEATDAEKDLVICKDAEDMFTKLGI